MPVPHAAPTIGTLEQPVMGSQVSAVQGLPSSHCTSPAHFGIPLLELELAPDELDATLLLDAVVDAEEDPPPVEDELAPALPPVPPRERSSVEYTTEHAPNEASATKPRAPKEARIASNTLRAPCSPRKGLAHWFEQITDLPGACALHPQGTLSIGALATW